MPLLKTPTRGTNTNTSNESPFAKPSGPRDEYSAEVDLLKKNGAIKKPVEERFLGIMDDVGLDPRSVLLQLAYILQGGETDSVKLQAAKLALMLHMHPALISNNSKREENRTIINFSIQSDKVNIANILKPGSGGLTQLPGVEVIFDPAAEDTNTNSEPKQEMNSW